MAAQLSKKFYELVDETVVKYICSREDVIEVCSRWFMVEKRDMDELPKLLNVYGRFRSLGYSHETLLNKLQYIIDPEMVEAFSVVESEHKRILREDIRLIRDD